MTMKSTTSVEVMKAKGMKEETVPNEMSKSRQWPSLFFTVLFK